MIGRLNSARRLSPMTAHTDFAAHTASIVSAFVGRNQLPPSDVPQLIAAVHAAVSGLAAPIAAPSPEIQEPAVPIRRSITDAYLVCLEDGAKLRTLKRYLMRQFGLTPEAYRTKWKLPASYPMTAPAYARMRSDLAKKIGLGNRPKAPPRRSGTPR